MYEFAQRKSSDINEQLSTKPQALCAPNNNVNKLLKPNKFVIKAKVFPPNTELNELTVGYLEPQAYSIPAL